VDFGGWRSCLVVYVRFGALRAPVNRQSVRISPTLSVDRQSSPKAKGTGAQLGVGEKQEYKPGNANPGMQTPECRRDRPCGRSLLVRCQRNADGSTC
jgi:hypothetical protein